MATSNSENYITCIDNCPHWTRYNTDPVHSILCYIYMYCNGSTYLGALQEDGVGLVREVEGQDSHSQNYRQSCQQQDKVTVNHPIYILQQISF
jgi:hypothetical protein